MISHTVARRYARAIFELAEEADRLDEVRSQLGAFADLVAGHRELNSVFGNPAVSPIAKRAIFEELESDLGFEQLVADTIRLLIRKGRIHYLESILGEYDEMLRRRRGEVVAEVTSARRLGERRIEEIRRRLAEVTGKKVELSASVDPELLGGLVARIGDTVYDGSVENQLQRLRKRLVEE